MRVEWSGAERRGAVEGSGTFVLFVFGLHRRRHDHEAAYANADEKSETQDCRHRV